MAEGRFNERVYKIPETRMLVLLLFAQPRKLKTMPDINITGKRRKYFAIKNVKELWPGYPNTRL
jgi:hypothetical protein